MGGALVARQNAPFTGFGTDAPNTSLFASIIASLNSPPSTTQAIVPPSTTAVSATTSVVQRTTSTAVPSNSITSQSTSEQQPTVPLSNTTERSSNVATITSSSSLTTSSQSASSAADSTSTSAVIGLNTPSANTNACHSISCSSGLQAAVAVPVVVVVLAIVGLLIFLHRRQRRSAGVASSVSKTQQKPWTRHLRIFGFDNELVTGGRFSSSNSSRDGESQRDMLNTPRGENPSMHSMESAAPPYKDAVRQPQPPSMVQTGQGFAAGGLAAAVIPPRTTSRNSAPPPYGAAENRSSAAPSSGPVEIRNPFSDVESTSSIEEPSPFRDPSDDGRSARSRPSVSRNSSIRTGQNPDDQSVTAGSDAGSIHEAKIGRHLSIASSGRITHIRHSSQSPPNQSPPSSD